MKQRFTTIQFLTFYLCIVLVTFLTTFFAVTAHGQNLKDTKPGKEERKTHRGNFHASEIPVEYWKNVGVLPPASVTNITGARVEYSFLDGGVNLGSLELEGTSSLPPGFSKEKHKGWMLRHHLLS